MLYWRYLPSMMSTMHSTCFLNRTKGLPGEHVRLPADNGFRVGMFCSVSAVGHQRESSFMTVFRHWQRIVGKWDMTPMDREPIRSPSDKDGRTRSVIPINQSHQQPELTNVKNWHSWNPTTSRCNSGCTYLDVVTHIYVCQWNTALSTSSVKASS